MSGLPVHGAMWIVAAALVPLLFAPLAGLAPGEERPLEIDILEGYLATYDRAPDLPHCARHHGYVTVRGEEPRPLPTGPTNDLLAEHTAWHIEHEAGGDATYSTDDEDRRGDMFFLWHEAFVARYDAWRAANGYGPVEPWDPATPMPPHLAYAFPGRGCAPGRNTDPGVALPTWATVAGGEEEDPLFGHTALCEFADINQLGKSLSSEYHVALHARIGGDNRLGLGPRDPAFWAMHDFITSLMVDWQGACGPDALKDASTAAPPSTERAVPGAGWLWASVAALGAALFGAGRRRAR